MSQSHSQRSLTNLFTGLVWALSNQVLKPVGEHHNQLLNPNCFAALERPRLRIMRLCYLQTALGNPHPALVNSGWVQPRLMQNLQHPEGLQSSENEGEVTQPSLTAGGTECVCVCVCVCVCARARVCVCVCVCVLVGQSCPTSQRYGL